MRFTEHENAAIRQVTTEVARVDARVFLFGSRTRDDLRGGDIDLLIELSRPGLDRLTNSLRTGPRLQQLIGERKIDVLVTDLQTTETPLIRAARSDGIALGVRQPSAAAERRWPRLRQTAEVDQWRHHAQRWGDPAGRRRSAGKKVRCAAAIELAGWPSSCRFRPR